VVDPDAVDGRAVLRRLVGGCDENGEAEVEPMLDMNSIQGTGGTGSISTALGTERGVALMGMKAMVQLEYGRCAAETV